jgi:OmpA-OmpF porin, OOP family
MMRFAMRYIATLILPFALLGCSTQGGNSGSAKNEGPGAAAQSTGLNAQQERITYNNVFADRKNIDALQDRLRKLNEAGVVQNNYSLAKAQCWLDTAKTQYHENDRTGYIEESMTESQKIIQALETNKGAKVGYETPLVARSTRLRDDLWAELSKFKGNESTMVCNARTVACAEVRLVRAGHAEEQTGWRAATPHVMMVEDGIRRASQEAAACAAPVVARAAPAPVPATVVAPVAPQVGAPAAVKTKETFVLLGDTLFKFDKSGSDEMLPGGKERVAQIVERLKNYQSIDGLVVSGHTDRLGSDQYNDPLSARRASTVLAMIERMGIKSAKTNAFGKGKREPVTTSCSNNLPRAKLIECLQPDRRVTIEVTGVVKQ